MGDSAGQNTRHSMMVTGFAERKMDLDLDEEGDGDGDGR